MKQIKSDNSQSAHAAFDKLLRPRTIALIGASASPGSLGASVLNNLNEAGYSGTVYLVNPKKPSIHGQQCLGAVEELPSDIDCAVLAIPAASVLASAAACAQKGIRSLIVYSAGFAEAGVEGQKAQRRLAEIVRENEMILEGPNCLGMANYIDGIPLTFVVTPPQAAPDMPGAAIISQSGALVAVIAVNMRRYKIPLTFSVSTGNEASSGVEDFVDYLIGEKHTRVLVLIVEQFRQPKRFLELADRARAAGQFIVLLHPGRSKAARASSATHTGAIAGDYDVMRALVSRHGVILVESMEELVDVAQVLIHCTELPREGPAIVTESGAFKAIVLDLCERLQLELPQFSTATQRSLRKNLPAFIPVSNPLDLTAQALVDPGLYRKTLVPVLEDEHFGSVMLGIILTDPKTAAAKVPPILDAIRSVTLDKPLVFAALDEGALVDSTTADEMRSLGVARFPSPERAVRALARVTSLRFEEPDSTRVQKPGVIPLFQQGGLLPEYKSKVVLSQIGITIPAGRLARTVDEALCIGNEVGFPVALKAQSAHLPHKSDVGGVMLGIRCEDQLRDAWSSLRCNPQINKEGLLFDGVLVERMCEKGAELILGARNDPQWGPVVLVGFGGVLAEAIQDTRLLPPDLPIHAIEEELKKLRCSALLSGFRGSPPLDVRSAAEAVSIIGGLMRSCPEILEIDINPLVVYPENRGAIALDALISVRICSSTSKIAFAGRSESTGMPPAVMS